MTSGASGWTKESLQRGIWFPQPLGWYRRKAVSCSLQRMASWPGGKGLLAEVQTLIAPWQGWWTVRYKHQQEMTGLENLCRCIRLAGPGSDPLQRVLNGQQKQYFFFSLSSTSIKVTRMVGEWGGGG